MGIESAKPYVPQHKAAETVADAVNDISEYLAVQRSRGMSTSWAISIASEAYGIELVEDVIIQGEGVSN